MSKRYYIAYGSNLSLDQMAHRCPDARVEGKSLLPDWKLVYRTYATIEPAKGRSVPVLVWSISEEDEKSLDRYEDFPDYYFKQDMRITMTDLDGKNPAEVSAMVYIMTEGHSLKKPSQSYLELLDEGYRRFGFNPRELSLALQEVEG